MPAFSVFAQTFHGANDLLIAQTLVDQGKFREALVFNQSIPANNPPLAKLEQIQLFKQRGYILTVLAKMDSAQYYLSKALTLASSDSLKYPSELGDCLHYLALSQLNTPGITGIEGRIRQAIELRRIHAPQKVVESQLLLGKYFMKTGKIPAAASLFQEILDNNPKLDPLVKAKLLYEYGVCEIFLRKHKEALSKLTQSLDLFHTQYQEQDHPDMVFVHSYLSYLYGGSGKLLTARKHSERALEIQHKFFDPDHQDFGILYYYAGGIYNNMAEFDKTASYIQEALRIEEMYTGKALNNRTANYYMTLGAAYKGKKEYEASLTANQLALDFFTSQEREHPFIDQLYANIGMTYNAMGDSEKALEYLELSYQLARKKYPDMHPGMIVRFKAFADCYLKKGDAAKALEYYAKITDIEAQRSGGLSSNLAKFLSDQGEIWRKELKDKNKALDFQEKALKALNMHALLSNPDLPLSSEAEESPKFLVQICSELGKTWSDYGETEEEKQQYKRKALNILIAGERLIDSTRNRYLTESTKLGLAQSSRLLYETAIEIAFQLYQQEKADRYLETAFRMSEKSKALVLLLGLKHVQALQSAGIPETVLEKEQELELQLMQTKTALGRLSVDQSQSQDSLQQSLFALNGSRDSLILHLEQNYPQYHGLKYKPNIPKIKEVQQDLLQQDQAGMVYFLGSTHLFSFYITPEKVRFNRQELPNQFSERVQKYRDLIYAPLTANTDERFLQTEHDFIKESRFLHELLLSSIEKEEKPFSRLCIIPDGILSLLNFDLLLSENPEVNQGIRLYPFAIKDYAISYAYSTGLLQYLAETKKEPITNPALIAFQPTYPPIPGQEELFAERRAGFGPLKFSEQEVEGISEWYSTAIFSGKNASEESFYSQASHYPIIHISSHAMVPESNPQAAFVAFTETENPLHDDSLMLEELYAQRLHAEMVVLSACETGAGKLIKGEGIMSLGRAFTYAGARSLVMSLWQVNDASTARIMTRFYQYLAEGKTKDIALRQAKLDYLDTHDRIRSQPYYWAAFVASGDMDPIPSSQFPAWAWILGIILLLGFWFWWKK